MSCELHHVYRFDKFPRSRVEPGHYPTTMSTAYKITYVEKVPKAESRALDRDRIRTDNPIAHSNKELLAKSSVTRGDYKPKDLENNRWMRDTKTQSSVDHVATLLSNYNAGMTTEYRAFLADKHEPDFIKAKVKPLIPGSLPAGEKRSVYNEDFRLKTAGMPTYEIAKKSYEENVKIAREALSGKNVELKGGAPVKNSSTYKTTYARQLASSHGDLRRLSTQEPLPRPNPMNNWTLGKKSMQKSSVYKDSYVDQHVTNCVCHNY